MRLTIIYLVGEVIFNAYHPSAVPDFIFSVEDAGFNPLLEAYEREAHVNGLSVVSPLVDWNYKDPSRLLSLIVQFRYVLFANGRYVLHLQQLGPFEKH